MEAQVAGEVHMEAQVAGEVHHVTKIIGTPNPPRCIVGATRSSPVPVLKSIAPCRFARILCTRRKMQLSRSAAQYPTVVGHLTTTMRHRNDLRICDVHEALPRAKAG